MIEIIRKIIDLMIIFLNSIFSLKVEFQRGQEVEIGVLVVAFVFIVIVLYLILKAVGIGKESDN